jgi:hypothetical protein
MIRQLAASGAVIAAVVLPASAASAAGGDPAACDNFARPIVLSQDHLGRKYDPLHLDTDHNGIACEHNPGDPVKTDLYADLRGETDTASPSAVPSAASPTLAHTGGGDVIHRHPVRTLGAGAAAIGVGTALVLIVRRRTN